MLHEETSLKMIAILFGWLQLLGEQIALINQAPVHTSRVTNQWKNESIPWPFQSTGINKENVWCSIKT